MDEYILHVSVNSVGIIHTIIKCAFNYLNKSFFPISLLLQYDNKGNTLLLKMPEYECFLEVING
jgi:hypothetical protein